MNSINIKDLILACKPFAELLEYPKDAASDKPVLLEVYPEDIVALLNALSKFE